MRDLIHNSDLRRVFVGAAGMAAMGLMLGGFMQPHLREDFGGPRIEMGGSGIRAAHSPPAAATLTSYGDHVPDYVVGTDWVKPPPRYDSATVVVDVVEEAAPEAGTDDRVYAVQTSWQEPPRAPTSFPSATGGEPYEDDLPLPPEPPYEDDAPAGV